MYSDHMKDNGQPKTEVLTFRATPQLVLWLKRKAGPYGSMSKLIRSLLENVSNAK